MAYPRKDAPSDWPIDPLLAKRWSQVLFSDRLITEEHIHSLWEAVRWTPSSSNEQPWRIIYATWDQPEAFQQLASLLNSGNAFAKKAYLLAVLAGVTKSAYTDKNKYAEHDTGAAMQSLLLQAAALGLAAHPMAGFDRQRALVALPWDEEVKVLTMVAIGYPGDEKEATDDLLVRHGNSRQRKQQSEFVKLLKK
ncbi:MAG: nitroreductase family protein [Candidatus Komeilibacteria bacterium]